MSFKDNASDAAAMIVGVVVIGATIVGVSWGGWALYDWLAPKYEGTRRDVMIESRYYSEATVRELYRMKRQWEQLPADQRATIEAAARHEFGVFDKDRLPPDLRSWLGQIQ